MILKSEYYDETKDPIFTIKTLESNKTYKIYLDGRVEGFGEKVKIFNRIPTVCSSKRVMSNYDILLGTAKAFAKVIKDNGWQIETFYSDTESKSLHSDSEQEEILYKGSAIIFSPSSSEEK